MKLKYLFSTVLASAFIFGGCEEISTDSFDNLKLDKTYLSINEKGGSVALTVEATEDWKFVIDEVWPETVSFNKDSEGKTIKPEHDEFGNLINDEADIKSKTPSWLKASVMEGKNGKTTVTFTAEAAPGGRELELALYAGSNKQFVRIRQGSMEAQTATCADVLAGVDGKTYRVKGICTQIQNTTYGNWLINDGTGEFLIYGTLDKDGKEKNFSSIGIEVGDQVTVEGPRSTHNGAGQLVNVTVIKLEKSLLKIATEETPVEKAGGEISIKVAYKGNGVFPSIKDECKDWISYVDMQYKKGEPSKLVPNPADTAIVVFDIAPNEAVDRSGAIVFASHSGSSKSEVTYTVKQKGNIPDAILIADAVNSTEKIAIEGTVMTTGCQRGFIVSDKSASLFIYTNKDGFDCNDGDVVKIVGTVGNYNCGYQIATPLILASSGEKTSAADPQVLDGAAVDAIIARTDNFTAERVTVTGTASLDSYKNLVLKVDGADGTVGSYYSTLNFSEYDGKTVTVTGYIMSRKELKKGNQALILVESVEVK